MAIQKKSLISALKTAKKANIASAQPPTGEGITPEIVNQKNLRSTRAVNTRLNLRSAKSVSAKSLRSAKSMRSARSMRSLKSAK